MEAVFDLLQAACYVYDLETIRISGWRVIHKHGDRDRVDTMMEAGKIVLIDRANTVHNLSKDPAVQEYLDIIYDNSSQGIVKVMKDALDSTFMNF